MGLPGDSEIKASARNAGDLGSIPGLGRSLEKKMSTHSIMLAWEIPWTEEPGRLQFTGPQKNQTRLLRNLITTSSSALDSLGQHKVQRETWRLCLGVEMA